MKKAVTLFLGLVVCSVFMFESCKPDTSKDDPIGTAAGKRHDDMGKSEDTTAAASSTMQ